LRWTKRYIDKPATENYVATRVEVIEFEEIIIRDIKRMDDFPNVEQDSVGISEWFKLDVLGFYDRGIEVFLSDSRSAVQTEDGWRLLPFLEHPPDAIYTACVGRIPFHFIERIDWSRSDPYYFAPHFYCHFIGPLRGPYEDVIYKAKLYPRVSEYYSELGLHSESYEYGLLRRSAFLLRQDIIRSWRHLSRMFRRSPAA
jgi:hypothetical protein